MSFVGHTSFLRPARRLRRDESGAALLEMTVVTPFLLVLGFGFFEFSNALYQYHLVTGGIRDAARFAAGLPVPTTIDQDEVCDGDDPRSTPIGCAKRLALTGQVDTNQPSRVDWWEPTHIEITYPTIANNELTGGLWEYRGGSQIARVVVSTTYTYQGFGLLEALGMDPFTVTTAHEERHYGVR